MNRKRRKGDRTGKRSPAPRPTSPPEGRTAEAATVAWMLAMLATAITELVGLAVRAYVLRIQASPRLELLSGLLLLAALTTGVTTLALTPAVLKLRRSPPPPAIVTTALVVGSLPLITLLARFWR